MSSRWVLYRSSMSAASRRLAVSSTPHACALRFLSTRSEPENSSSLLDTASDFFVALRWKAAASLTSSLSSKERKQLLDQLHPSAAQSRPANASGNNKEEKEAAVSKKQDSQDLQHSIAEAVAAARAKEAQLYQSKWEKQKDDILKEAQQAAMARVESDLAIQQRRLAFERWQQELEQEKKNSKQPSPSSNTVEPDEITHPVLGPAVVDLGYKRVHVITAQALASIPVWKKQRIYRHDRAKTMAADKLKTLHLGMPGVIGLYEDGHGKLAIIDGQHRVGMMTILQQKETSLDLDRILVEVYPQQQDRDQDDTAQDLFLEVNKAEPVKLVDMPGVAKGSDRKMITQSAARLQERFPDMFRPSQNCRSPHLNVDNLRDALFAANVIQRHEIKSAKALEEWMMDQNEWLKVKLRDDKDAQKKVPKTAMAKALKFSFYLGLESSWLYQ